MIRARHSTPKSRILKRRTRSDATSMEDRDGSIWADGRLVPWREARFHVLAQTLHHGMGVFEGARAYMTDRGPEIFRLHDHTDRLFRSAHILQMEIPFTREELNAAHFAVLRANDLAACYLRPIAFLGGEVMGVSARGNSVHVAIAAWPWDGYLGAQGGERGVRVKTSSFVRYAANSALVHAKACGHYINSMLTNREAVTQGFDEALMLDGRGFVAEGSTENIFVLHGRRLSTPERSGVLEGITRSTLLTLAAEAGLEVIERTISRDEVYCADEAFFTGTAAEVTPIRELDGRRIGAGSPGPVTRQLRAAYLEVVTGRNPDHSEWRTAPLDEHAQVKARRRHT